MQALSSLLQSIARHKDGIWRLAFIVVISLFTAKLINAFIGFKYLPLELPQRLTAGSQPSLPALNSDQAVNLPLITSRNIFDSEARKRMVDRQPKKIADGQISPSTLNAELLGTMVFSRSKFSVALLKDKGTNKSEYFSIGQTFMGAAVARIERFRVILDNNGRLESLDLKGGQSTLTAKASPVTITMGQIEEVSPTQKVIPQSVLDDVLNNFSKVLTQARMVPNITDDNKTDGFKIFQIKPDSIYEKLGLKDNDIIKRVNGQDLDNFEKATGLFTALRNEKTISIDVVRNGTRLNYTYEIR